MSQDDLKSEISQLERILSARMPTPVRGQAASGLTNALREIFASVSACSLFSSLRVFCPEELERVRSVAAQDSMEARPTLPPVEAIEQMGSRLLRAVEESDVREIVSALQDSGILTPCLPPDRMLDRLELSVSSVMRLSQVLPLIELALIAVRFDRFQRAAEYAARARSLEPGAAELHDLWTIDGLIALHEGNRERAKECLVESVHVCEKNYHACLSCGVRAYNTVLAQELLAQSEKVAVLDYLRRCEVVWRYGDVRLASWINSIEKGEVPDLAPVGVEKALSSPQNKITTLAIRSSFLHEQARLECGPEKPLHETLADLKRLREAYRSQTESAIRGRLETNKN